ncbi:hypothetical protein J1N35_025687 [Gossypium stocksii]|uniref:Uncharacterized protein n=1 Tax=Gossypium stocksii TaxID=47602 RepID=A0A9D3V742_9ROSI|nr:hypothetical protein J1N35_025687 [Gossypium stocksii]
MPENTGLVPDTGRFGVLDIFRFCYFAIPVPRISHPLDVRRQIPRSSPNLAACKHAIASAANGEATSKLIFTACPLCGFHRIGSPVLTASKSLFLPVRIAQIAPPKILHWCLELVSKKWAIQSLKLISDASAGHVMFSCCQISFAF